MSEPESSTVTTWTGYASMPVSRQLLDAAPKFNIDSLIIDALAPLGWKTKAARRRTLRHVERHIRYKAGIALRSAAKRIDPSWSCPQCREYEAREWDDD
jgi:hypothetical protein